MSTRVAVLLAAPFAVLAFVLRLGGTLWLQPLTWSIPSTGLSLLAFLGIVVGSGAVPAGGYLLLTRSVRRRPKTWHLDAGKRRFTAPVSSYSPGAAPPTKFSGGGYWEAMHGDMKGWFEVRCDGRARSHHRLFCLIDLFAQDASKPWLVVIAGLSKPFRTTFSDGDYVAVRALGDEYRARNPRSVA